MMKYLFAVFLAASTMALAACDSQVSQPQLQDQQVVCTLKGEAYIFIEGYQKRIHSVRSVESDPLCIPLRPVKPQPASGASS
jgi:uncharacterized protein YcfL